MTNSAAFDAIVKPSGVTIVIPAYNYEQFVGRAVQSALDQDWEGTIEVLVVDDGSTDGTAEVVEAFGRRVRYLRKKNGGLSAARNTGMVEAGHDWVVFLDADDELEPGAVRELWQACARGRPRPVVVGSLGRMIGADGEWLSPPPEAGSRKETVFSAADFVLRNRFAPIVLADRRVLLALGGFDPELKASEDRDMWVRAATTGPVLMLHRALHRKRDHGANMSKHALRQTDSIMRVLKKAADNPKVEVREGVLREARAICLYQSARMYLAAGDRRAALAQCLRSLGEAGWLSHAGEAGFPPAFRLRFLILGVARWLGQAIAPGGRSA